MAETTPNHTQTVFGWAAHDNSGKITPYTFKRRFGIDSTMATFADAAFPVKMPSEGSEKSIGVPRQHQSGCGCKHPCKCNPCHCNGFAIDPNAVPVVASVAPPVLMMPSDASEKSIEAKREGIHPKL